MAGKTVDNDLVRDENNRRNWSDILPDISSTIRSRLFVQDEYVFNSVCKSWRTAPQSIRELPPLRDAIDHQSTCLMFIEPVSNRAKFFHPIYNEYFLTRELPSYLSDAKIRCSKYGWLLMSRPDFSIFFFNPISGSRIKLPDIPSYWRLGFGTMCFTSPPTSDECSVIGISSHVDATIGVLQRGKSYWEISAGTNDKNYPFSESCPILHEGSYFVLGVRGLVGEYDPTDNTWDILGQEFKHLKPYRRPIHHVCESYLLELDGDLVAVFVLDIQDKRSVRVWSLDLEEMVWWEIHSLGDKMIYVSNSLSFAETATVSGMANKIYFPKICRNTGVFYSMKTKRFGSFSGAVSNQTACQQGNMPFSTWIKPTEDVSGDKEITW